MPLSLYLNFIDYGAEFEKNLCAMHEFSLNRGQNVQVFA